jgi:hypothetical protein
MMMTNSRAAAVAAASAIGLVGASLSAANPEAERFWPQWRGPYATGVSVHANPPEPSSSIHRESCGWPSQLLAARGKSR